MTLFSTLPSFTFKFSFLRLYPPILHAFLATTFGNAAPFPLKMPPPFGSAARGDSPPPPPRYATAPNPGDIYIPDQNNFKITYVAFALWDCSAFLGKKFSYQAAETA